MRMQTRIERLEAAETTRQKRLQERVVRQLTTEDRTVFAAYLDRWEADPHAEATAAERRVLCRVEALIQADPHAQPGDYIGLPPAWMQEHGYAAQ